MTRKEKVKILEKVLERIKIYDRGMCVEICEHSNLSIREIQKLFKLLIFKPKTCNKYDVWFLMNEEGREMRIKIIQNRIKYFSIPWYKRIFISSKVLNSL